MVLINAWRPCAQFTRGTDTNLCVFPFSCLPVLSWITHEVGVSTGGVFMQRIFVSANWEPCWLKTMIGCGYMHARMRISSKRVLSDLQVCKCALVCLMNILIVYLRVLFVMVPVSWKCLSVITHVCVRVDVWACLLSAHQPKQEIIECTKVC